MAISLKEFDFGFRRMCTTFGVQYSTERMTTYYDVLGPRIPSPEVWKNIVRDFITKGDSFPRVSALLKHEVFRHIRASEERKDTFDVTKWVLDDCRVKECVNGYIISVSADNKYETAWCCPRCEGARKQVYNLPLYQGRVTFYTDDEMDERRKERKEVAEDDEYRWKRGIEIVRFCQYYEKEGKK